MKIVLDIECDSYNPKHIWVIVCKDIETSVLSVFREGSFEEFKRWAAGADLIIGHNILDFDLPVLERLIGFSFPVDKVIDTFVVSKLVDFPRERHSIEDYGKEFGIPKGFKVETGEVLEAKDFPASFFLKYSKDLEEYCIRDVEITHRVYLKYKKYLDNPVHKPSVDLEHRFQQKVINSLTTNGFCFNLSKAKELLSKVESELKVIDEGIKEAFLPKLKLIRVVTPKQTKYGTISLSSIPKALRNDVHLLTVGAPFSYCQWVEFNPSSHSQIIALLNEAGWSPVDKTKTHIDTEREFNKLKYRPLDTHKKDLYTKLISLQKSGWKVNENNLETLPPSAPPSARLLAKRILLEARRRTLTEQINLVQPDGRIHGKFIGIGAWTHRMAHQNPNTANIPNELDTAGRKKLLGKELRSLWCAPKNRLLVGVDAEGIQLRIFAHYINDPEFTDALVRGRKDDKTDPHSLNQRILGSVCKSRAAAKRYIYALLLGAGQGKLQEILGCDQRSAAEAYDRLLERYTGFAYLKETIIPRDAKRGWFSGLDGRRVRIPGETEGARRHLAMSGYLQNGEAVVMKSATLMWIDRLSSYDSLLVNLVHDEWQTETPNDMKIALQVAKLQADSLRIVGEELNLKCPLAGSYWNDDLKDYTIHKNWSLTH